MKRAIIAAALVAFAGAPLGTMSAAGSAAGKDVLSGAYVEARTAEVFTGGCVMNSRSQESTARCRICIIRGQLLGGQILLQAINAAISLFLRYTGNDALGRFLFAKIQRRRQRRL